MINNYQNRINLAKRKLTQLLERRRYLQERKESLIEDIQRFTKEEIEHKKALEVFQLASGLSKEIISEKFSKVISEAISAVTEQDLVFNIELTTRGDEIEAKFLLDDSPDIINTHGSGIADIIAIMLRVLIMSMYNIDAPLILDEPTSHLSKENYSQQIGKLLKEISKTRQIILTTHSKELAKEADCLIKTQLIDRKTVINTEDVQR